MTAIRIEVDTRQIEAALEVLTPSRAGIAIARALNDTAKIDIAGQLLKTFSREIGISQAKLRRTIRIRRVSASALARVRSGRSAVLGGNVRTSAQVTAAGADISTAAFSPRQLKRAGVSFGRPRQRVAGGFVATLRSGHRAAFVRATNSEDVRVSGVEGIRRRRRVRPSEFTDTPIAKLVVPGVSSIMLEDALQNQIEREGSQQLAKRLRDSVLFELNRATGRIRRPARGR